MVASSGENLIIIIVLIFMLLLAAGKVTFFLLNISSVPASIPLLGDWLHVFQAQQILRVHFFFTQCEKGPRLWVQQ